MTGGTDVKKETIGKNFDLETCLSRNINKLDSEKSPDR